MGLEVLLELKSFGTPLSSLSRERDGLQSELDTLRHAMVEMEGMSRMSREEREQARKEV